MSFLFSPLYENKLPTQLNFGAFSTNYFEQTSRTWCYHLFSEQSLFVVVFYRVVGEPEIRVLGMFFGDVYAAVRQRNNTPKPSFAERVHRVNTMRLRFGKEIDQRSNGLRKLNVVEISPPRMYRALLLFGKLSHTLDTDFLASARAI